MAGAALLQEREPDAGAGAGQLRGRGLGHLQPAHRLHAAGQLWKHRLELQTNHREDFTITAKAPTRAFSWLNAPSTFSFHY